MRDGLRCDGLWAFGAATGVVATSGLLVAVWLTLGAFPVPREDEAVFKSAAAELAQHGVLAAPCMEGVPGVERVFALYPPVYPLTLAAWYSVFGVTLRSSIAFCFGVHLVAALLVMTLAERLMRGLPGGTPGLRGIIAAGVGLAHLANITYFDRPEELALLFLFLDALLGDPKHQTPRRTALSGILCGLAALTAPWVGVLAVLRLVAQAVIEMADAKGRRARFRALALRSLALLILAITFGSWLASMEIAYPGALRSQFLHVAKGAWGGRSFTVLDNVQRFLHLNLRSNYNPPQLAISIVVLLMAPVVIAIRGWREFRPVLLSFVPTAVLGVILVAMKRPEAYTYVGASQMMLHIWLGPVMLRYTRAALSRTHRAMGFAILAVLLVYSLRDVAWYSMLSLQLPAEERYDHVAAELRRSIPPGQLVSVSARHWHVFQGRNPWRDALFAPTESIRETDWIVLPKDASRLPYLDSFVQVKEIRSDVFPYGTYVYSLWRRKPPIDP